MQRKLAMPLAPAAQKSFAKWLAMNAKRDFRDLPSIIAADAVFHSPVGLKPYTGRELVCLMLRTAAAGVFEDFKYRREFLDGENAALEFSAHISNVELKAVHFMRFNAAGEIVEVEVMGRPAEGVMALGNAMGALIGPQIKAMRAAA
jgi:SnoaL-like domain